MLRVLIAGLPDRLAAWMARRMEGVLVEVAWNADAAYNLLRDGRWSLLVLDAGTDAHGAEVLLRLVRDDPRLQHLPLIVTVDDQGEHGASEATLESWVHAFRIDRILLAPVDRGELVRAAGELLRRAPVAPAPPPAPSTPAPTAAPAPSTADAGTVAPAASPAPAPASAPPAAPTPASAAPERVVPARLAAGLSAVWRRGREAVEGRLSRLDAAVAAAREGRLTGDLRAEAEREAHRLAGALGTFGSDEGSRVARVVEHAFAADRAATVAAALGGELAALRTAVASLDATHAKENEAPAPAAPAAPSADTGMRVLVVDDDAAFVASLRREGATRGIAVEGVAAAAALERALAQPPVAVLMDLAGGEEEGEAWVLLSQLAMRLPAVPVLVVAARGSLLDRVRILQMGARMFLQKPLPADEVLEAVLRCLPRAGATLRRVLAVDDDPSILEAVKVLLEPQGYEVRTLDSPLRFWGTLKATEPDLVVMDVDMPFLNGIELCRVVRGDHRWADLPVLFLTAHTDADTILRVFAAGADDYVTKPLVGPELSARVRNRLDRVR